MFLKDLMKTSKNYQSKLLNGLKVVYCGTDGAFSHIATIKAFPNANIFSCGDFKEGYSLVENGTYDCAVLPIENSYAGDVGGVMDLMFQGSLFVNRVVEINVEHCLLGVEGSTLEGAKKVISHEQALMQCEEFIKKHNLESENYSNTALAAKYIKEKNDKSLVVIASKETAEIFGLKILQEGVNTSKNNTTRFAVFSRTQNLPNKNVSDGNEHFILTFTTKNEAGALAQALNIIGAHNFNMRSLRSRPMKELIWNYYFYVEAEGNIATEDGQNMLKELSAICARLKLVGTYN